MVRIRQKTIFIYQKPNIIFMKKRLYVFLFVFILLSSFVFAHGDEKEYDLNAQDQYLLSSWEAVIYGSAVFIFLILIIIIFHKSMKESMKKFLFCSLCAVCTLVTLYLVITTLHLNITSWSKGPVHWHADYEIWACDKMIELEEPEGISNIQGVDLLHAHDDNRMHVEGVLLNPESASIGAYFNALGGKITNSGFTLPSNQGTVSVENGQMCNGMPAALYVFVNGNPIENYDDYAISHYENVPPGDRIKIIFTEKPIGQINPYIGAEPMPEMK